mgnify:CR=1 FL=1
MEKDTKIGFLGGGRMAEALVKGILDVGLAKSRNITVVDPVLERCDHLNSKYKINVEQNAENIWKCDIIVLAVKPQVLTDLLDGCKKYITTDHLVISIAAGVPLGVIESHLKKGCRVVRVMPNTPALILEGASALSGGTNAGQVDVDAAQAIFDAIGKSVVLPEYELDAVTGLSGSGPAYVYTFLEALTDAGVKVGLGREVAEMLAMQTVLGSVKLAMVTGQHPAELRAMVTSPGGTTIAGLHELERAGFKGTIMDAIESATERSRELGRMALAKNKEE